MAAKIFYDKDADLSLLKGKTIAILGYGSQGHAQALNLRDSGCQVVISELPGTKNHDLAVSHGFQPLNIEEATKRGDLINILLPDELQGDIYRNIIRPNLQPGNVLMCSHGFNIHSVKSSRLRASTRCWWLPKVPAIWSAANSRKAAACPA
jgi:ketol-acid reductoisomerase